MNRDALMNGMSKAACYAKQGAAVLIPVLAIGLLNRLDSLVANAIEESRYPSNAEYSDAVKAICNSDMYSSHKTEAIASVKQNQTSEYYKAIIATVISNQFSSHKVETIKKMNANE